MTYAQGHQKEFPDGGLPTLMKEIGFLLGVPIHYYAAIDLAGFVKMVDLVGGVDDRQPAGDRRSRATAAGRTGTRSASTWRPGAHHLDGQSALAYVRSRKGVGDNDFTRSRRQQQVLVALGKKLADPTMLPEDPGRRPGGRRHDPDELPAGPPGRDARHRDRDRRRRTIKRYVLGPPYATYPTQSNGVYQLVPDMDRIAKLSIKLFGADSAYAKQARRPAPSPAP